MFKNSFAQSKSNIAVKICAGKTVLGLSNMYPASGIIEGMCKGYDFAWLDGQHGQHTLASLLPAVQACLAHGLDSVVRVPGHEHGILGPHADLAPTAIMVPMVNNAVEARHVVQGLTFPPLGQRSYGGRRPIDLYGREYFKESHLLVIVQIETLEAVENAEAIAVVEGVDGIFFGPDDMKVRMGIAVNTPITEDDRLRKAMEKSARAALNAGAFCGCVAANAATLKMATAMGYRFCSCGADIAFMRLAAANTLAELQAVLKEPAVGKPAERSDNY